jgi:hypothetical protein
MLSAHFVNWLNSQTYPDVLPNQVYTVVNVIDRLSTADVVAILYYGSDSMALKALKELKDRYHNELNALEEMSRQQEEQDNVDNWC